MKYINYKTSNNDICVGILKDDIIYRLNCSSIIEAINNELNIDFSKIEEIDKLDLVDILPPTNPSKVVCIGLNYKDHAKEFNMDLPKEPLLFMKPSTSVISHEDYIIYPDTCNLLDFEGELGIIILDKISSNSNKDISKKIAFTIINDVTARDLQEKDGQWTRSKSFDTFCPYGPVAVTNINPSDLKIVSKVNGELKQSSNTNNMIFSPTELVKYISNIMTLNPGDLIATGTPPGVDHLKKEDIVEITIENIGTLKNIVK